MSDQPWSAPGSGTAPPGGPPPPPPPPPPPGAMPPPPPGAPPPPGWGPSGWGRVGPRSGLIPLYPMRLGELLDTGFKLLRAAFVPSLFVVLIVMGPGQLLASIGATSPFAVFRSPEALASASSVPWFAYAGSLLALLAGPIARIAITWIAARADEGVAPDWVAALQLGLRRFLRVLGAWLLLVLIGAGVGLAVGVVVGIAIGLLQVVGVLLAIPLGLSLIAFAIVLVAAGYLVVPVVTVEDAGAITALRRSWSLVRSRFWPVVGIVVLTGLVLAALSSAVSVSFLGVAALDTPLTWLFIAVGGILSTIVTVPLRACIALTLYVDLRVRSEGYDLALLVAGLRA